MIEQITLSDVTESDMPFLYEMIKIRDKREFLGEKPTYEQHVLFVKKFLHDPERHHYESYKTINLKKERIGCVILHKRNNEIGYYLLPEFQKKGYGSMAVKELMSQAKKPYYTALIHNYNTNSQRFLEKLGGKPYGVWYMLKNNH